MTSFFFSAWHKSARRNARMLETSENLSILFSLQMCLTLSAGRRVSLLTMLKFNDLKTVRLKPSFGFSSSSKMISSRTSLSSLFQEMMFHEDGRSGVADVRSSKFSTRSWLRNSWVAASCLTCSCCNLPALVEFSDLFLGSFLERYEGTPGNLVGTASSLRRLRFPS